MRAVFSGLVKAVRQLADPAVLRVLGKSLGVTLGVFAVTGAALYLGLRGAFAYFGLSHGGLGSAVLAVAIAAIAFWFLFRIVALAVLQFFADEIVAAVERRHFPQAAAEATPLPFREDMANALRGMGRALGYNLLALPLVVALAVTGIGPAIVFVLVNAVLLGRELTDMAWLRHCGETPRATPVRWLDRFALGGVVAGVMLIPGLGLLAPVIGAAAGTHVAHMAMGNDRLQRKSGAGGENEEH